MKAGEILTVLTEVMPGHRGVLTAESDPGTEHEALARHTKQIIGGALGRGKFKVMESQIHKCIMQPHHQRCKVRIGSYNITADIKQSK